MGRHSTFPPDSCPFLGGDYRFTALWTAICLSAPTVRLHKRSARTLLTVNMCVIAALVRFARTSSGLSSLEYAMVVAATALATSAGLGVFLG